MSSGRGSVGPEFDDTESLLREAHRRAREVVLDELVTGLVRGYRQQLTAYLTPPAPTPPARHHPAPGARPVATPVSGGTGGSATSDESVRSGGSATLHPSGTGAPDADQAAAPRSPTGLEDGEPAEAWYVYAIARRAECEALGADEVAGIENRPVCLVWGGELAAVAAQVPLAGFRQLNQEPLTTEESWLAASVRSHEMVVAHVFSRATVLPLRFGALYPSAEDVTGVLHSQAEALHAELLRLQGTAEWGVTAELPRADRTEHPVPASSAPPFPGDHRLAAAQPSALDGTGAGTAWMRGQQSAARARSRARQDRTRMAGEIHEAVGRHARESVAQRRAPGDGTGLRLLDRSYLVERQHEDRFRLELGALSDRFRENGLSLRVTGPWPPYHFVQLPERIGHG